MKRLACLILILAMLLALSACGAPDPNCGVYKATTGTLGGITLDVDSVFDGGFSIELKDGGRATLSTGGNDYRVSWKLDGENVTVSGSDESMTGTLIDGTMILKNVLGSGVDLTLEREG